METANLTNGTRYYVMAVTPTRLYSFTGIGTLEVCLFQYMFNMLRLENTELSLMKLLIMYVSEFRFFRPTAECSNPQTKHNAPVLNICLYYEFHLCGLKFTSVEVINPFFLHYIGNRDFNVMLIMLLCICRRFLLVI